MHNELGSCFWIHWSSFEAMCTLLALIQMPLDLLSPSVLASSKSPKLATFFKHLQQQLSTACAVTGLECAGRKPVTVQLRIKTGDASPEEV
jgi:hypothetical protein